MPPRTFSCDSNRNPQVALTSQRVTTLPPPFKQTGPTNLRLSQAPFASRRRYGMVDNLEG